MSASDSLNQLLARNPGALVAALGSESRLVPMPASVPLRGQLVFDGDSGIDLIVAEDRMVALEGWALADEQPVVRVNVRLLGGPDELATLSFFDVREEHGVHVIALEADDPTVMVRSVEALSTLRRGAAHVTRDIMGVFVAVDEVTTALLGWAPDELIGRGSLDVVHPDDLERAIESWMAMRSGTATGRVRVRYRHTNGNYVWVEVTNDNRLDDPELGCVLSELVDISAEMAHFEALRDRERLLARLAEALPIGICHLRPDREVVYTNEPLVELLGPIDTVDALIRSVVGVDRRPVGLAVDSALQGDESSVEVSVVHGFEERRCELTFRAMTGDDGTVDGVIVCAADVTDRSRLRSELEHRASHDALSGCLNRAATVSAFERALREYEHVAVAYIDLDHFKSINDELGHSAGDELLRVVAARMRSVTRAEDRLGRIGGDEFVVICPQGQGRFEMATLVDRLSEAINGDVVFAKQRIPLRASVGAAMSLDGELDAEALLSRADAAMYAVKRRARLTAIRAAQ